MNEKEHYRYQQEFKECVKCLGGLNSKQMTAILEILKSIVKTAQP